LCFFFFFFRTQPLPVQTNFASQQTESPPVVQRGRPSAHGPAVVVVVVVVAPVHAWSTPHVESFWQVAQVWPPAPQAMFSVPTRHAPLASQQPVRRGPKTSLQMLQTPPPVPQTKTPLNGNGRLTGLPDPFWTQTSSL
jgi:hypothetical protein